MANPQKEDGHTDLSNEIVDALGKFRIPGEEMQVLWCVLRKTYGWHKKEDSISLSQFSEFTGLKRSNVARAIKSLVSKAILGSLKSDTSSASIYWFQKDYTKWNGSLKNDTPSLKSDNCLVSKVRHTKETIQKKDMKERGNGFHLFKNSPFFEYEKFSAKLSDWPKEKITYYHQAAINDSEAKGRKYLNWISAIRNWDRMRPDEWKKSLPKKEKLIM